MPHKNLHILARSSLTLYMNAFETQITRLYQRGLPVETICEVLKVELLVVMGVLKPLLPKPPPPEPEPKPKPEPKPEKQPRIIYLPNPGSIMPVYKEPPPPKPEKPLRPINITVHQPPPPKPLPPEKPIPPEPPPIIASDDIELAMEVVRYLARQPRTPHKVRLDAATILLDESKGRRNIAADVTKLVGAAALNEVLRGLQQRRDNAYGQITTKTINEHTETTVDPTAPAAE